LSYIITVQISFHITSHNNENSPTECIYFKKVNVIRHKSIFPNAEILIYRDADKSLARPGRKQATASKL